MYADQYDMILFLDDDDTYTTNRVAVMCQAFVDGLNIYGHSKPICVREIIKNGKHCDMPEYWAYGVQPLILQDFFKEIHSRKLLRYIWNKMGERWSLEQKSNPSQNKEWWTQSCTISW